MLVYDIKFNSGNYCLVYDDKMGPAAYRHGEPWGFVDNMVGAKVILSMVQRIAALELSLAACEEFVRKCDEGQAKSVRSYAQMKAAIEAANKT